MFLLHLSTCACVFDCDGVRAWSVAMVSAIVKMAEGQSGVDSLATEFATYSDFLDSQVTPTDLYYLEVCKNKDIVVHSSLNHVLQLHRAKSWCVHVSQAFTASNLCGIYSVG